MYSKVDAATFLWPASLVAEFQAGWENGHVGLQLVSETDKLRVWHLNLEPGERFGFHMHVLDYFWTALSAGRSRSHFHDGHVSETEYTVGMTRHFSFEPGQFMIHDLENIGASRLSFVTVESKESMNTPLKI